MFSRVLPGFLLGGGVTNKLKKNSSKICLYAFLLRFYDSDKNLSRGAGFKPRNTLRLTKNVLRGATGIFMVNSMRMRSSSDIMSMIFISIIRHVMLG